MIDLFNNSEPKDFNILPYGGCAIYYGKIMNKADADLYYQKLLEEIKWEQDQAIIFGKHFTTERKVAWYGEKPFSYTYSNVTKTALPFNATLDELNSIAARHSEATYNSCLLNLYHNGTESMAWHSDGEKDLQKNGAIGSMSFGAERKFSFKHKVTKEVVSIVLEHGSLLVMKDTTQTNWLHRLPPTTKIVNPRVNLTFRTIVESSL